MGKFSEDFALSVIRGVKKECFMRKLLIPSDQFILSLMKLFILNPGIFRRDNDSAESVKKIIQSITKFLKTSNSPSIVTLKMQLYFSRNHHEETALLHSRLQKVTESIDPLQNLILRKTIKYREDYDQLYHHLCCLIVLANGIGDPTDNEILRGTIGALKSILTTKDLARFALKSKSLKEKQLKDISRIVVGILVYNRNYAKKEDDPGDLITLLENALKRCYSFLENKLLELDERISSLIHSFLKYYSNIEVQSLFSTNSSFGTETLSCESMERRKYIKSFIICMQQYKMYFRILSQVVSSLIENFKVFSDQLQKRLIKVRKTVKFRKAIPVVEIYPQFKDISLSWDKMQEISTLLNNAADIASYLRCAFEKISSPQFDLILDMKSADTNYSKFDSKIGKSIVENIESPCEHVLPVDAPDFHLLHIEFSGFCIVMFVETEGILTLGIKEYGLIKYKNEYFAFSSIDAVMKFCLSPEKYIEKLLQLAFIWPEIINLLQLENRLKNEKVETSVKGQVEKHSVREVSIQTDVHPTLLSEESTHGSAVQFRINKISLWEIKNENYRTHAVQTDVSSLRKEAFTQTLISMKRHNRHSLSCS